MRVPGAIISALYFNRETCFEIGENGFRRKPEQPYDGGKNRQKSAPHCTLLVDRNICLAQLALHAA